MHKMNKVKSEKLQASHAIDQFVLISLLEQLPKCKSLKLL